MAKKFWSGRLVILTAVLLIGFLAAGSGALAQGGNEAEQDTQAGIAQVPSGGPGFISIPATAFRPKYSYTPWHYWGAYLYNDSATQTGNYIAAVDLPHGATITKLTFSELDLASPENLTVELRRVPMFVEGNNSFIMASATTSLALGFGYVTTTNITNPEVNNQEYAYYVEASIPAGANNQLCLKSVRIDYEFTSYLSVINR